jgi:hypothetical protein
MKQLIFLLIPISLFSQKGLQDTIQYPVDPLEEKYNMVYYSSSLIKKENKSIWYYASYDLIYGEEVGIGFSLRILNKKRKKLTKKKKIHIINIK